MEFRSTRCVITTKPSARVNTGFSRICASGYSPSRNVVASQDASFMESRCTNSCVDMLPSRCDVLIRNKEVFARWAKVAQEAAAAS